MRLLLKAISLQSNHSLQGSLVTSPNLDIFNSNSFDPVRDAFAKNVKDIRESQNKYKHDTLESLIKHEHVNNLADRSDSAKEGLLWLNYALEFLHSSLVRNIEYPKESLKESFGEAYEKTLGTHHNWMVRMAVRSTFGYLPEREEFYKKCGNDGSEQFFVDYKEWLRNFGDTVQNSYMLINRVVVQSKDN